MRMGVGDDGKLCQRKTQGGAEEQEKRASEIIVRLVHEEERGRKWNQRGRR